MADLSITASSVVPGSNASTLDGIAGETITAGKAVYKSSTTLKWMLADSDSATAEAHDAVGIALNGASLNQPVRIQRGGDITLGAVLTAGAAYYVSSTAGGICPAADLSSGEEVCLLGLAESTSVLALNVQSTGVTL